LQNLVDLELDSPLSQRKLAGLGLVISRVVAMDLVLKLGERGFNKELIDGSLVTLQQEIASSLTSCTFDNRVDLIEPEQGHPSWRDFCS
jgi:hypothetical protein